MALVNAGLDAAPQLVEVLAHGREGGRDRGCIENSARPRQCCVDLFVRRIARSPAFKKRFSDFPFGIAACGEGFADTGGTVTKPDGAIFADGLGEFHEAFMGAGFDEGGARHLRRSSL